MSVRVIVTDGTAADCSQAQELRKDIDALNLLADRGYDTDEIIYEAGIFFAL